MQHTLKGMSGIVQSMELDPELTKNLSTRLSRIEGQVRAIRSMLEEGRECREVITQISAASTALDQVGFKLLSSGMQRCLQDPKKAGKEGFTLEEVEKLFLKLK
jgi:DNA-binding FrmR family transcriptional regulator